MVNLPMTACSSPAECPHISSYINLSLVHLCPDMQENSEYQIRHKYFIFLYDLHLSEDKGWGYLVISIYAGH